MEHAEEDQKNDIGNCNERHIYTGCLLWQLEQRNTADQQRQIKDRKQEPQPAARLALVSSWLE